MTSGKDEARSLPLGGRSRDTGEGSAPYDAIAPDYADLDVVFKQGVIGPSLCAVLGSLLDETAIDWACGSGEFSTIPLVTICHAKRVLGIDRSPEMIREARTRTKGLPQITYMVGNAATMDVSDIEPVMVASSVFLLNYAEDRDELTAMYDTVAKCLRKGGRFVTVVPNPLTADVDTAQYGMCARTDRDSSGLPYDGATRIATLFPAQRKPFSFKTYWYSEETYLRTAAIAGLEIKRIAQAAPSHDALRQFGADFFRAYQLPHPQHLIFEFVKRQP
jgi:toxoflavin synthase